MRSGAAFFTSRRELRKTGQGVDEWRVFMSLGVYLGREHRPLRSITESSERHTELECVYTVAQRVLILLFCLTYDTDLMFSYQCEQQKSSMESHF